MAIGSCRGRLLALQTWNDQLALSRTTDAGIPFKTWSAVLTLALLILPLPLAWCSDMACTSPWPCEGAREIVLCATRTFARHCTKYIARSSLAIKEFASQNKQLITRCLICHLIWQL
jgi:hypothetical protein